MRNLLMPSLALCVLAASGLWAQSLDPNNPTPLKPGVNTGNIDAFMTPQYWTFIVEKGKAKINMTFRAQSVLGAQIRTFVGFNLYNPKTPDKKINNTIESSGDEMTHTFEGPSDGEQQMVIEVVPPKALVRLGGPYQIQAVEGIRFMGAAPAGGDPILTHHFRKAGCNANDPQCGISFQPAGVIALPGGDRGSWRLFDRERAVYVLVIGNERQSLKLKPGVGLVQIQGDEMVVYQEVR